MVEQDLLSEREVLRRLDSRHLPYLDELDTRILAGLEFGFSIEQLALGLDRGESTVRNRVAHLKTLIFDPLALAPSTLMLNHWTRRHFACCTKNAEQMIGIAHIFPPGPDTIGDKGGRTS